MEQGGRAPPVAARVWDRAWMVVVGDVRIAPGSGGWHPGAPAIGPMSGSAGVAGWERRANKKTTSGGVPGVVFGRSVQIVRSDSQVEMRPT
jgi:hypothetical protein